MLKSILLYFHPQSILHREGLYGKKLEIRFLIQLETLRQAAKVGQLWNNSLLEKERMLSFRLVMSTCWW